MGCGACVVFRLRHGQDIKSLSIIGIGVWNYGSKNTHVGLGRSGVGMGWVVGQGGVLGCGGYSEDAYRVS